MKPKFTIFTPTYNRAYTLQKTFQSLMMQNFKDFEWIVYDDGSTDNTEEVVEKMKQEAGFAVRYFKSRENKGKHHAWNYCADCADGEFFIVLDSDDCLVPNAMEKFKELAEKIKEQNDVAGFSFIHFTSDMDIDFLEYGKSEWYGNNPDYSWKQIGEMGYCYKTALAYAFPFPEFNGEKFCPESLVHRRIAKHYKIFFTDHVLMRGEYLQDGLSQNYWQRLLDNPQGALLSLSERMSEARDGAERRELAKNYFGILRETKKMGFLQKIGRIRLRHFLYMLKH